MRLEEYFPLSFCRVYVAFVGVCMYVDVTLYMMHLGQCISQESEARNGQRQKRSCGMREHQIEIQSLTTLFAHL